MKAFAVFLLIASNAAYAVDHVQNKANYYGNLEKLRLSIEKEKNGKLEEKYLALFPKTFSKFKTAFGYDENEANNLYAVHEEHLQLLFSLIDQHPETVVNMVIEISSDAEWEADAVGIFQNQLATYAANHTCYFARKLIALSEKERNGVVKFIADVENYSAYKEFDVIVRNMDSCGYTRLSTALQAAKNSRQPRILH